MDGTKEQDLGEWIVDQTIEYIHGTLSRAKCRKLEKIPGFAEFVGKVFIGLKKEREN
jgi:hypothetical protein